MSAVDDLAFRAFMLCDDEFLEEELNTIRMDFISNSYPISFINKRINKMENKVATYSFQSNTTDEENPPPRLILPFMGSITSRITNLFRSKINCNFGYIPGTKIGSLICNMKERLSGTPSGIYKITCSCGGMYIGETSRPFNERVDDHLRKNGNSAVCEHIQENPNHVIKLDSASLVEVENRPFHRIAKEGLYIQSMDTSKKLNKNNGKTLNSIISTFLLPLFKKLMN